MKRLFPLTFTILTLLAATLACNLFATETEPAPTVGVPTSTAPTLAVQPPSDTPPSPTETLPPADTPTQTPTGTSTGLPPATPTHTSQPASTSTSTPSPDASRIQFATGGTWTEVVVSGHANTDTTFVLAAAEGQVMSVSVYEGPGYLLTIKGEDGTVLTPPNSDKYFWRGTLPATQDYIVTVTPYQDGDFTLRVAINPPGQAVQFFDYANAPYGLSQRYSDTFAPVEYPFAFLQRDAPALALNFLDTAFYENTNLSEAYFVLNIFNAPDAVVNCYQPYYEQELAQGQETFNGYTFEKSTGVGVGAGNIYEQTIYRTVENNACIEVVFFIHYGNIGNYDPGVVTEFDREALVQMFEGVLETLTVE